MDTTKQKGFTLLELSIVLVIIGLIVGAILVGQDLIKSAEIRATVAQVEKYNSAVNTFRTKFNAIPGDITQRAAADFGLLALSTTPTLGQGDGNSLLEGGSAGATEAIGETIAFWRHLSEANLIDGSFGINGNSAVLATGLLTGNVTNSDQSLPVTKLTPIQHFIAYSDTGFNYYQIMPIASITAATGMYGFGTTGISPIQAYNMDIKLDDGNPNSGIVIARATGTVNAAALTSPTATANNCLIGTGSATDTYNLTLLSGGNDPSCSARFRFN